MTPVPRAYLPLVALKGPEQPAKPYLQRIVNADGDGNYSIFWDMSAGSQTYQLQEDDNSAFSSPVSKPAGSVPRYDISGQLPGAWYYRVRGRNQAGYGPWSNVQSVIVSVQPTPTPTAHLVARTLYGSAVDTTLESAHPEAWYGDYLDFWVGYGPDPELGTGTARALLYFDLSSIPRDARVISVSVQPYLSWYVFREGHGAEMTITAYRVVRAWPAVPTWTNAADALGEAYGSAVAAKTFGYLKLDVTALVQAWIGGAQPNYGLMLRGAEAGHDNVKGFASADAGENAPRLVLQYYTSAAGAQTAIVYAQPSSWPAGQSRAEGSFQRLDSARWSWGIAP